MATNDNLDHYMDLVVRHQADLFGYIYALVRNNEDTRDLHQQTLMILWRKFDQFEPGTNFLAWAIRIAQFEVLKYRERQGRREVPLSDAIVEQLASRFAAESPNDPPARAAALAGCLEKLRDADRQLVQRSYLSGLRIKEIAQQLGRSESSICNSLRRVRRTLFECIDRKLREEDVA